MNPGPRSRCILPALVVGWLACLVIAACSTASNYRVLSAVFDGVPPPPGTEKPAEPSAAAPASADGEVPSWRADLQQARATKPQRTPPPVILSVHKPVAERLCSQCHNMNVPLSELCRDATLCDRCHKEQRQREGWDHGPINLGTCIPCHLPHRSPNVHLLSKPLPDLCLGCHETLSNQSPEYHRVANFNECTACHDPHRMY